MTARRTHKLCSCCRIWQSLKRFAKHGTVCNDCRAIQNRVRIERNRNRKFSRASAWPRVTA